MSLSSKNVKSFVELQKIKQEFFYTDRPEILKKGYFLSTTKSAHKFPEQMNRRIDPY